MSRQKLQRGKLQLHLRKGCISVIAGAITHWLPHIAPSTPSPEIFEHRLLILRRRWDSYPVKPLPALSLVTLTVPTIYLALFGTARD